jgi:hypothetical protein
MPAFHRNHNVVPLPFDRRHSSRRPGQYIGKILIDPTVPPQYCLVTETSEGGVRICTADFEVPSVFTLRFENTEARYQVIWLKGQFVGAQLASQEASRVNPSSY